MDFNRVVNTYSEQVSEAMGLPDCDHDFFLRAKADRLLDVLGEIGSAAQLTILDVGCGIGLAEKHLEGNVGRVVGVDVASDAVRTAAANVASASFVTYDGLSLPFPEHVFDAAFAICVLHHVEPQHRAAVVREMARVVRPGGLVVIFEHNPWNPVTRRVVNRCEFDRGVILLSAPDVERLLTEADLDLPRRAFLFFFPWLGGFWRRVESYLGWLPLGAQHVAYGRRKGNRQ